VVIGYFGSAAFQNLAPASQRQYRGILERLRREHGDKRIATLERRNVIALLNAKAGKPAAARNLLYCVRVLVRYAIDIGLRDSDPTAGIKIPESKSEGLRMIRRYDGNQRRPPSVKRRAHCVDGDRTGAASTSPGRHCR
jgi:hypothetical protein